LRRSLDRVSSEAGPARTVKTGFCCDALGRDWHGAADLGGPLFGR
jgi:hypothetical protein